MLWQPNRSTRYEYFVYGLNWVDIDRYSIEFWVVNGTIVSETDESVTVNWDDDQEEGQICIDYFVDCPGGDAFRRSYCLRVIIDEHPLRR